jgi:hypothetical protein
MEAMTVSHGSVSARASALIVEVLPVPGEPLNSTGTFAVTITASPCTVGCAALGEGFGSLIFGPYRLDSRGSARALGVPTSELDRGVAFLPRRQGSTR